VAVIVCTDFVVVVNAVDLSDHVKEVALNVEVEDLDSTVMGTNGWRSMEAGLKTGSFTITFLQDFAASEVDATLWGALGTKVTVSAKPTSASTSATNPLYSASALINMHTVGGAVGQLGEVACTFPTSGAVTRATS
jgi:hypothetical protein